MEIQSLLQAILLGGLLGMIGQAIRTIVGIKKENDSTNEKARASGQVTVSYYDSLSGKRLTISLLIGFTAGVLAYLFLDPEEGSEFSGKLFKADVLAIIASGYAGVDFIEGFMNRYLPEKTIPNTPQQNVTPSSGGEESNTVDSLKLPPVPPR
jgi:hypothetical protein